MSWFWLGLEIVGGVAVPSGVPSLGSQALVQVVELMLPLTTTTGDPFMIARLGIIIVLYVAASGCSTS